MAGIDTGDRVYHRPTGETWLVARVDGDRVYWCGYPFGGFGSLGDCQLEGRASEDERAKLLAKIASSRGRTGANIASWAKDRLEAIHD
ncbi:MAG: hypothetical protein AAGH88_05480 [Planctomycetota bacterium]